MTKSVHIVMHGVPKGKGRPQFNRATGSAYTPASTRTYERRLSQEARVVMYNMQRDMFLGPVRLIMKAYMPIPKSWPKHQKRDAKEGVIYPCKTPDADNLLKVVDALNGIVFHDDCQVVQASVSKQYSENPRVEITIEPLQLGLDTPRRAS